MVQGSPRTFIILLCSYSLPTRQTKECGGIDPNTKYAYSMTLYCGRHMISELIRVLGFHYTVCGRNYKFIHLLCTEQILVLEYCIKNTLTVKKNIISFT